MHDGALKFVLAFESRHLCFRLVAMREDDFVELERLRPFTCCLDLKTPLGVVRVPRRLFDRGVEDEVFEHVEVSCVILTILLKLVRSQVDRIL